MTRVMALTRIMKRLLSGIGNLQSRAMPKLKVISARCTLLVKAFKLMMRKQLTGLERRQTRAML